MSNPIPHTARNAQHNLMLDFMNISSGSIKLNETESPTISNRSIGKKKTLKRELFNLIRRKDLSQSERKDVYDNLTKEYGKDAIAVILVMKIVKKSDFEFQKQEEELEPKEKLSIIQKARSILNMDLFNSKFRLVKFDECKVFAMCYDPVEAMKAMIKAEMIVETIQTPEARLILKGGCGSGTMFVLKNNLNFTL